MTQEQFILQLEIVADPDSPATPATLGEIERYTIEALSRENYNVNPVYTGQRGGGALFEILKLVEQGAALAWLHHKGIVEVAQALSAILIAIKAALAKINEKQNTSATLKITLSSKKSGITTVIEGTDQDAVVKAVEELEEKDPGIIASRQTKLTAQIQQPSKRHRR